MLADGRERNYRNSRYSQDRIKINLNNTKQMTLEMISTWAEISNPFPWKGLLRVLLSALLGRAWARHVK